MHTGFLADSTPDMAPLSGAYEGLIQVVNTS